MSTRTSYFLRPHSPLVFRSGRAAISDDGSGSGASYDFPLPSTVAGALRGAWVDASRHMAIVRDQTLLDLAVGGGLRAMRRLDASGGHAQPVAPTLLAPRPADALYAGHDTRGAWLLDTLSPLREGFDPVSGAASHAAMGGTNMPAGLWPLAASTRSKPLAGPEHWTLDAIKRWLSLELSALGSWNSREALPLTVRSHAVVDDSTLTLVEGGYFQSTGVEFGDRTHDEGIVAWLDSQRQNLDTAAPAGRHARLGADGATATLERIVDEQFVQQQQCPGDLSQQLDALREGQCFRLLLLTPACYERNGWFPDGFRVTPDGQAIEGSLTSLAPAGDKRRGVGPADWNDPRRWRLRLRAAALGAWLPMAASKLRRPDGKLGFTRRPLRRLVPAGAVYWLEILRRGQTPLSQAWMQASCRAEYARDGFGLALPGLAPDASASL